MRVQKVMALSAAAVLTAAGLTAAAATSAQAATCPDNSWQPKASSGGYFTATMLGDAVNIRTGPSTSCTSVGTAYRSHTIRFYCYKGSWSAIKDVTTGKSGWVLSTYVDPAAWWPC